MTRYLISFPSASLTLTGAALQAASDDSHAVVADARRAGVWVFGGGIDEGVPPVLVAGDGTVTDDPRTRPLDGGFAVLELPSREAALHWAARLAAACRCPQEVRAFMDDPTS